MRSTPAALARAASDEDRQFMAQDHGDDFPVRRGRVGSRGNRINPRGSLRSQPFLKQVQVAVRKAGGNPNRIGREPGPGAGRERGLSGRFNARGRGAKIVLLFLREGRDGGWQQDSSGRFRSRRVAVKARIIKLNPQGKKQQHGAARAKEASKSVDAHLRYLERDGVDRDGQRGKAYPALENAADGKAFVERGRDDRHQFRFIVAPEDSHEMAELRSFTRDLMRQVQTALGTRRDWIAIDHYNTGHPHTHIIVRGVLEEGGVLNIAGDYIA